jgi:hypothetical protein
MYTYLNKRIDESPKLNAVKNISKERIAKSYKNLFYHDTLNEMNFFQINVSKALGNIGITYQFEAQGTNYKYVVACFKVDILVDNRIIIEPDGPDHFIINADNN